jgi:hypothetical protein
MDSEPSDANPKEIKPEGSVKFIKEHILIFFIVAAAVVAGAAWQTCIEINVKPRDFVISQLRKRLAFQDEIRELRQDLQNIRTANKNLKNILKIPPNEKIGQLEVSRLLYKAPGQDEPVAISQTQTVQAGGKIWFEIQLPEPGGYLLAYLEDSMGRKFNLFPGTRHAAVNGYYRIPYHLNNPRTQIQKLAAYNTIAFNLPLNKIMIGGYTFDQIKCDEIFHFYYFDKRNEIFESIVGRSKDIGKDMPQMRGILDTASGFDPQTMNKTIDSPIFYKSDLTLRLKHE